MIKILRPFQQLPQRQEATVLIIGEEGIGKHDLAKSMVTASADAPFHLKIHTATKLPLPDENDSTRPRIDFICFMLSMTSRASLNGIVAALSLIDVGYFLGKSCLVVTEEHNRSQRSMEVGEVTELSDMYDITMLFGNLKTEDGRSSIAEKILKLVEPAACFKDHITCMTTESSTSRLYTFETL